MITIRENFISIGDEVYQLFESGINLCNGERVYDRQWAELIRQMDELLSLQSALGQSSQGHSEDHKHRQTLISAENKLKESIRKALRL